MTEFQPGDIVEILQYGPNTQHEPYPQARVEGRDASNYIRVRTIDTRIFSVGTAANCLSNEIRLLHQGPSLRQLWSQP